MEIVYDTEMFQILKLSSGKCRFVEANKGPCEGMYYDILLKGGNSVVLLCQVHLLEGMNIVKLALDAVMKWYVGDEESQEQENLMDFIRSIS